MPKLKRSGRYPDGRQFLVTELVEGVRLDLVGENGCLRPNGRKHTDNIPCETCSKEARSNALRFITEVVQPQLACLTSRERGINGFVMPPSWLNPVQPPWRGKVHWQTHPQNMPVYVFQHGDIAAHNIMMDAKTLEPKALIDWEYAGYFPPGMERWTGTLDFKAYTERGRQVARAIATFLHQEYLECFEQYADKEELQELVQSGVLPHPDHCPQS